MFWSAALLRRFFLCPRNIRIDGNEDSETPAPHCETQGGKFEEVSVKAFKMLALFRVIRGPCKVFAGKQDFPAIAVQIPFAA
jgi:hypothetical protein